MGRYLQADPIGQTGGMNVYLYAQDSPVNWIDPSGLASFLVARPTDTNLLGRPLADHLFIATDADYVGDPDATIIAFGQGADGNIEKHTNEPTHYAAWVALGNQAATKAVCKNGPYSRVPASDAAVSDAAARANPTGDYAGFGFPFGTNSNEAAQAIANEAAGATVPTPSTGNSAFGPFSAGSSARVPFRAR